MRLDDFDGMPVHDLDASHDTDVTTARTRRRRGLRGYAVGFALTGAMAAIVGFSPAAGASSGGSLGVAMRDDCDPVTFAVVPGGCTGDGDTTLSQLLATLAAQGSHPKWRFNPADARIKASQRVVATNRGGEFHTFTEVADWVGSCAPPITAALGDAPAPAELCANIPASLVTQGRTLTVAPLAPGTHKFQCLIHPWMRTTLTVSND